MARHPAILAGVLLSMALLLPSAHAEIPSPDYCVHSQPESSQIVVYRRGNRPCDDCPGVCTWCAFVNDEQAGVNPDCFLG